MKQWKAESSASGAPLLSTDTAAHAELRMRAAHNCPHYFTHFGSTIRAAYSTYSYDCSCNIQYNGELRKMVVKAMWSPAEPKGQYWHCLPTEQLTFGCMDGCITLLKKAHMIVEQLTHISLTIRKRGRSLSFKTLSTNHSDLKQALSSTKTKTNVCLNDHRQIKSSFPLWCLEKV